MVKRRRDAGFTIAAGHNRGIRPNLETDSPERALILVRGATGQEHSGAIDFPGQSCKDCAQTVGSSEPKVGWRQFPLIENAKFTTVISGPRYSFNECPGGFRATAFDTKNALIRFHGWLSLAVNKAI